MMITSSNHSKVSYPVFVVTLFLSFLVQGCTDPVGVRDVIRDRLVADSDRPNLTVYENGAVLASGRIQRIAEQSFDLVGTTFEVSDETEFLSVGGVETQLSSVAVGQFVEVDGNQLDDGSFEATFVEELDDPGDGDDPGDEEGDEEGEESVVICHIPPGNPDNARTKSVDEGSVEAHMAHGDYAGECVDGSPPDDAGDDGEQEDDGEDDDGQDDDGAKVLVCHIPPGNPDNARTLSVDEDDVQDHLDHGDREGDCDDAIDDGGDDGQSGDDGDDGEDDEEDDDDGAKVLVCHIPPGNPDNARTLSVDEDDVQDHLDHGDREGDCDDAIDDGGDDGQSGDDGEQGDDDDGDEDGEKVVICHVPPGNPDNAKTKSIDSEDLQEHLDHGDYLGECEPDDSGGG